MSFATFTCSTTGAKLAISTDRIELVIDMTEEATQILESDAPDLPPAGNTRIFTVGADGQWIDVEESFNDVISRLNYTVNNTYNLRA
jgi:chemotaxis regulatin CheY-phosphate phosphatase CheZ